MMFMNTYEIDSAAERYAAHPLLGPAVLTLRNLRDWSDRNSDGWAYWPKPSRAAAKLQELIMDCQRAERNGEDPTEYIRRADLTAALRPVKSFRTRYAKQLDARDPEFSFTSPEALFDIIEELPAEQPKRKPQEIAALLRGEVTVELVDTTEARADDLRTGYAVIRGRDWTLYADTPTVFRNGEEIYTTEEVQG